MDWNNDGKNDLLVGDMVGTIRIYINKGTKENPVLDEGIKIKAGGKEIGSGVEFSNGLMQMGSFTPDESERFLNYLYANISFTDWNNDGLEDIIVGNQDNVHVYKNIGTKGAPKFDTPVTLGLNNYNYPIKSSPYLYDCDNDGKLDLILSVDKIYFYKNTGTKEKPQYGKREVLNFDKGDFKNHYYKRISIVDWNNDGKPDILAGTSYFIPPSSARGNVWLFLGK